MTRFDGTNYLLGASDSILDGVLNEYLRVNVNGSKFAGKLGIGRDATTNYEFEVDGAGHFGDAGDTNGYGRLQIARPQTRPTVGGNVGHYISMVRQFNQVSGLGYKNSSNILYIEKGNL